MALLANSMILKLLLSVKGQKGTQTKSTNNPSALQLPLKDIENCYLCCNNKTDQIKDFTKEADWRYLVEI